METGELEWAGSVAVWGGASLCTWAGFFPGPFLNGLSEPVVSKATKNPWGQGRRKPPWYGDLRFREQRWRSPGFAFRTGRDKTGVVRVVGELV